MEYQHTEAADVHATASCVTANKPSSQYMSLLAVTHYPMVYAVRDWRECPNCGVRPGYFLGDQIFIIDWSGHWRASPGCWEVWQSELRNRFRDGIRCYGSNYKTWCTGCDVDLYSANGMAKRCIYCKREHELRQQRKRRAAKRAKIECAQCGEEFTPNRTDAKFCSNACRQRAHRQRRSKPIA